MNSSNLPKALGLGLAMLLSGCATAQTSPTHFDRVIHAGRLYPSAEGEPIEDASVLIRDGRIVYAGPRSKSGVDAADLPTFCANVLVAGYWNSHVHLLAPEYIFPQRHSDAQIETLLASGFTKWGFTTIFDLASTTAGSQDLADRIENGRIRGSRILSVGEPFYPDGATPIYARPFYEAFDLPLTEVANPDAAAARAQSQIEAGDAGLKIFTGSIVGGEQEVAYMPVDIVRAIVNVAQKHGKPTFAHPTDAQGLDVALEGGVSVLAHSAPLMGPWSDELAAKVAGTSALVPTLSLFARYPDPRTPVSVSVQQTRAFHEAGGSVLFGTDAGFSDEFDPAMEMTLLERAIGWRGVLASLTTIPSRFYGEAGVRGKVASGYVADLVALGSDPAEAVTNLRNVTAVFRDGEPIWQDESAKHGCQPAS